MTVIKILLIAGIIYIVYKARKFWLKVKKAVDVAVTGKNSMAVDDVMIKDPFCGVYFPQRQGFELKVNNDMVYFCSEKCRDGFMASSSKNNTGG